MQKALLRELLGLYDAVKRFYIDNVYSETINLTQEKRGLSYMSGDDENFIIDEFEWALKDPTEEKLRALGDVVSTITKKLVDAIGDLDKRLYELEVKLSGIDSKVNQMASRGVAPPLAASDAASAASDMASAPMATAPSAQPPPTGGGGGLMGELKTLLAARRRKADAGSE